MSIFFAIYDLTPKINVEMLYINHEVSQGSGYIHCELFEKEKEYLLPLPGMDILTSYFSRQEEKTYAVNKELVVCHKVSSKMYN